MGTRSMTVIEDARTTLRLYRHWDGYPACAGKALADALSGSTSGLDGACGNATKAASRLLRQTEEATSFRKATTTYELADWKPEQQGDLEHIYTARGPLSGWEVEHSELVSWNPKTWTKHTYTLAEFTAFCEQEHAAMEERARAIYGTEGN